MRVTFVPIEKWPREKTDRRKSAPFRTSFQKTLELLQREIGKIASSSLGAEVLVQGYFRQNQIRNDGWPMSKASPIEPGIIITFTKNSGQVISMPCDTFTFWEDNFRAIALSLEALRTVDRYGVTQNGEQYRGWEALPAPERKNTMAEAAQVISMYSGYSVTAVLTHRREAAIKAALLNTHPDKETGSTEGFQQVMDAKKILEASNG